ncbi:hypothetical protein GYMLUDRAFT_247499 [Collybiopsis luxurians FD-317 M1]|uniref:Uncharacterized protein n=1 Tax=Collybiopsis luxurians FD-317 M1 TaxID=944289 RepID=A0A0D0CN77_9AGAR|nr:hypothetical protein GYMLUDRAFT_247499 [Collybiopsis luxurians FD-317 M1]
MSSSQLFTNQPVSLQSASLIPFSNALPSAPPVAKKMQCVAFECSVHLSYPSISITDCVPLSLPTSLQPIYEDAYLANSSPEVLDRIAADEWKSIFGHYPSCKYCALHNLHSTCSLCPNSLLCATCEVNYPSSKKFCSFKSVFRLLQFHILTKLPLIVAYCFMSSRGLFTIRDEEWTALAMGLQNVPYYCNHPEELRLVSDRPRALEGKRKAVVSLNAFQKSQLLQQERVHLGEPSCEPVVPASSRKGKEVIHDPIDVDVEMEAPEELDAMNLDYLEEAPPPPTPIPTAPAPIWKAIDTQSYSKVSGLKMWFFKPLVKQVPSDGSSLTQDKMVQTAIEHVVTRMASLFAGPGRKMLKQDLWALVDGMIQGAFTGLEEQLQHSPSKPPASFLSKSLLQFVESLTVVNMTSANIINSQQDELLQVYREYQTLTQSAEHIKAKNLQLKEKDKELTHLKSFVRHFKGDVQSSETQQLRGAMESRDSEIEELRKKLAASEEAHRVAAEELKLRDEELAQLRQLFESV